MGITRAHPNHDARECCSRDQEMPSDSSGVKPLAEPRLVSARILLAVEFPRVAQLPGAVPANLENARVLEEIGGQVFIQMVRRDKRGGVERGLIAVAERRYALAPPGVRRSLTAKRRGNAQVVSASEVVPALEVRIVSIGKKERIWKRRAQRAQDHQFVVDVGTEQADGPDTRPAIPAPVRVAFFQHARQSPQVIRLIQAFGCFNGDGIGTGIAFLGLFLHSSAREIARHLTVDAAQITISPDRTRLRLLRLLRSGRSADPTSDDFVNRLMGSLGKKSNA